MRLDPLAMEDMEYCAPGLCSISMGGGGGGKSKSTNRTRFNRGFLNQMYEAFPMPLYSNDIEGVQVQNLAPDYSVRGNRPPRLDAEGNPILDARSNGGFPSSFQRQQFTMGIPRFQGLEGGDFDKLQSSIYDRQVQQFRPDYERERDRRREELSQSGLLNSPMQYGEGGAINTLDRNFMDQTQKSASEAVSQRYALQQQELARKLGFDMDLMKMLEEMFMQRADLAARVGGVSTSKTSSSPTFDFAIQGKQ